jgi:hypothetical protein
VIELRGKKRESGLKAQILSTTPPYQPMDGALGFAARTPPSVFKTFSEEKYFYFKFFVLKIKTFVNLSPTF